MAPNEETDLSKVTQCLIHTECSIVLIGSQGLRKLNQDQRPQVEGLRWQTPWCISQQYMCISSVFLGYQSLSNPPPLLYMFQFQIWVNYWVLRQSTCWSTWKHHDYAHEERAFDRYKFQCGKSSRLYSLQIAIKSLGISQDHSWVP